MKIWIARNKNGVLKLGLGNCKYNKDTDTYTSDTCTKYLNPSLYSEVTSSNSPKYYEEVQHT